MLFDMGLLWRKKTKHENKKCGYLKTRPELRTTKVKIMSIVMEENFIPKAKMSNHEPMSMNYCGDAPYIQKYAIM